MSGIRERKRQRREKKTRFGKQPLQYRFILNHYDEYRFTRCPDCDEKTRIRKVPLVIFVEPKHFLTLQKTCRYCPNCDILIVHQNELEAELAGIFSRLDPSVVGNDYLVIGTVDQKTHRQGKKHPLPVAEMQEHIHDFKEYRTVHVEPGGWYPLEKVDDKNEPDT